MCDAVGNLFIIGVQKGGTTALHHLLTRHPQIAGGREKELHIFDGPGEDSREADAAAFRAAFAPEAGAARYRLEATPITIFWPGTVGRLARYNPDARLILLLRHPGYRAFSHWRMTTFRGVETLPFAEAITREDRRTATETAQQPSRVFSYIERGRYAGQVGRLFQQFPREAVLILRTDALWAAPGPTLTQIAAWLGLDAAPILDASQGKGQPKRIVPYPSQDVAAPDPALMARIAQDMADDIRQTARLTGLDLSDWLDPAYREPMEG